MTAQEAYALPYADTWSWMRLVLCPEAIPGEHCVSCLDDQIEEGRELSTMKELPDGNVLGMCCKCIAKAKGR